MKTEDGFPFTDRELEQAAGQVARSMLDALPEEPEPHVFSGEFEAKMDGLFRRERVRRVRLRRLRDLAAVLAVALVLASTWLATDTQARADFRRWYRSVVGGDTEYRYYGAEHGEELPALEPGFLPEDYRYLGSLAETDYSMRLMYQSDTDGSYLFILYGFMYEGNVGTVTSDFDVVGETVPVAGTAGDFYRGSDGGSSVLVWFDEEAGLQFSIQANRDLETIVKIAENLQKLKK